MPGLAPSWIQLVTKLHLGTRGNIKLNLAIKALPSQLGNEAIKIFSKENPDESATEI
jgi:hypothetical protein